MPTCILSCTKRRLRCCPSLPIFSPPASSRHAQTRAASERIRKADSPPPSDKKVCHLCPCHHSQATRELTHTSPSDNLPAANHHLADLLPFQPTADPELTQQVSLLEIHLLIRSEQLPSALSKITSLLSSPGTDLAQTLHLLTLKASVFAAAGKPEKGFSLAIRAASSAERAGLVPVLLEALAQLAGILNKVGEFGAAREVVEAALPQVSLRDSSH